MASWRFTLRNACLTALVLAMFSFCSIWAGAQQPIGLAMRAGYNYVIFSQRVFNDVQDLVLGDLIVRWGQPSSAEPFIGGVLVRWYEYRNKDLFDLKLQATALCPKPERRTTRNWHCRVISIIVASPGCYPFVEPRC